MIVNLTPHVVTIINDGLTVATFAPDGRFARLEEVVEPTDPLVIDDVALPTVTIRYADQIVDLPTPQPGVVYIASRVTAAAAKRTDVLFPCGEVRDETGRIIGCRALGRFVSRP